MTITDSPAMAHEVATSTHPVGEDGAEDMDGNDLRRRRVMSHWLLFMCFLTALMVLVGGATRLTDSGLSITEWKPVTGAIPPLSVEAWQVEFEKYKRIPEYEIVNKGMSLSEFKTIYYWEWGHRLLGRVIGLAFLLPMVFFALKGWVGRNLGIKLFGLFLLGGAQGALGWYMVQSGLSARVDVSQYRLAAHLGLAVFLFAAMLWVAMDLRHREKDLISVNGLGIGALALAAGVYGQIILGAFVAGLRAGHTYTTWPLMDGKFFPDAYFVGSASFNDLFDSIAAVQFNHRIGAYLVALGGLWFFIKARQSAFEKSARLVLAAIIAQIVLGIATLVSATPIGLGLAHQVGALAVLLAALASAHKSKTFRSSLGLSSSGAASLRGLAGSPKG